MTKWGLVATIKAPADAILKFAAHHLGLGAHRIYIYLDAPNPTAFAHLKAHPKIRVATCDDAHWRRLSGKRPVKHQVRQSLNATHAYGRRRETDWLAHIDVDEFLWPQTTVADALGGLGADVFCARVRPMEGLAGDEGGFKAFLPASPDREAIVRRLYPRFGAHVRAGFLSHVAGKLFVRTGREHITWRIHNVFQHDDMNPGETELPGIELCHCHATDWNDWIAAFRFRLAKGSYRADLAPVPGRETLHEFLTRLEASQGETGLRDFFDEIAGNSGDLRDRLQAEGLLRRCDLDLDTSLAQHFPDFAATVA